MNYNNRVFGLDLLRAYAIFVVVYGHGYNLILGTTYENIIPKEYYSLLSVADGVSIFFVLSGFLIGRILIRTVTKEDFNGQMLLQFWIRRWFRTLPNYFLVLSLLTLWYFIAWGRLPTDISYYYIFSQNFTSPHPSFFPEAWSLAVEEWFYLLIPIPIFLSYKFKISEIGRFILTWILLIIIFSTLLRIYRYYYFDISEISTWDKNLRKQVITRLDSLMYGVLGAYVSIYFNSFWLGKKKLFLWVGISLLGLHYVVTKFYPSMFMFYKGHFSMSVESLGVLLLLPALSEWNVRYNFFTKSITFISIISYAMYLQNLTPIQQVLMPQVETYIFDNIWFYSGHEAIVNYLSYWFLTIFISYLMYKYYEKPCTDLRDKWPTHEHKFIKAFTSLRSNHSV